MCKVDAAHGDKAETVDEYLAGLGDEQRRVLERVREVVAAAAPKAEETIAYGMPAFKQGRILIYYAAMKNHLGIYPKAAAIEAFADRLTDYKTSKGAIQFPWNKPIPYDLIAEIAKFNVAQLAK